MPFCVFGRKVDAAPSSFLPCVGPRRRSKELQKQADELYKATKERQDEEKRASSEREWRSSIEAERQSQEDRITKMVHGDELEEDSVSCSAINGVVLKRSASSELSEAMVGMRQSIIGARGEMKDFQASMMTDAQKEARAEAEAKAELQANPTANVLAKGWSKEADAKAKQQRVELEAEIAARRQEYEEMDARFKQLQAAALQGEL